MSCNVDAVVTKINETHIKEKSYVFTWVIKNLKWGVPLLSGQNIDSPFFRTDFGLCQLKLYPGGVNCSFSSFVSLEIVNRISCLTKPRSVISLVNKTGEESIYYSNFINLGNTSVYKFVKRCNITSDFLLNDRLTIKWKLYFSVVAEPFENSFVQSMTTLAETRRLAEFDDFEKLLKDSQFSDIKVVVDTQTFYAHKNILAARSRYFADKFASDINEVKESELCILHISANVMQEILRFIYTGKIKMEQIPLTNLLNVADMFQLDGLMRICEEEIISNMCLENIAKIVIVIDQVSNVERLKDSVIEFLTKNSKELSGNESFRNTLNSLSRSFKAEVLNIIMSKT